MNVEKRDLTWSEVTGTERFPDSKDGHRSDENALQGLPGDPLEKGFGTVGSPTRSNTTLRAAVEIQAVPG